MIFEPPGCSSKRVRDSRGNKCAEELTRKELGHIVGLAVHNHPARVLGVVLGDGSTGKLARCHCEWM